jgi:hypothetical protein
MSSALELIGWVESRGGLLRVEDGFLVVSPEQLVAPYLDSLKKHKKGIIEILENRWLIDDPAEWREPFRRWLNAACVRRARWNGGLNSLHMDFCDWEIANNGVPCKCAMFIALLEELDFKVVEVHGAALVSGLALRADVECVEFLA